MEAYKEEVRMLNELLNRAEGLLAERAKKPLREAVKNLKEAIDVKLERARQVGLVENLEGFYRSGGGGSLREVERARQGLQSLD